MPSPRRLACVEVGGGGVETVLLGGSELEVLTGAHLPAGWSLLMAVPGLIERGRVLAASNLGWLDVDPAHELGLPVAAEVVLNDAEAAALGESALRGGAALTFVGLGTGVGGAVVADGRVVAANLLGHGGAFGDVRCPCGRTGCLETVAAGWALADPLPAPLYPAVAQAIATAIRDEPLATAPLVVVAGGLTRRHPGLVDALRAALPDHVVEGTAAPAAVKSAAAWGLALAYEQVTAP
ncbi:MAG: ROK family protein [Frankiaceae bacterium]|nr:ROK family protein [Frankiaceae bacterium]